MQQGQSPVHFTAGARRPILPLFVTLLTLPLCAQARRYEQNASSGGGVGSSGVTATSGEETERPTRGTVSIDLLRYPLSASARHMLQRARRFIKERDHDAAIQQLEETLKRYPSSAPYTHSLLGVEYLDTQQYSKAVTSLEQAVRLLPHDPINHANLGLAFAFTGQPVRARQEARRALQLDPHLVMAERLLEGLTPSSP